MPRIVAAIVLVAVLAVGGGIIATTAYQAGVAATVTTTAAGAGTVVAPVIVPAYGGWGWPGPGFGFFGFLFALFFLFIVFGLIRAVIFGGRHGHGWGGPGWDPDERQARMRSRFHGTFEAWHREAHAGGDATGVGPSAGPPVA